MATLHDLISTLERTRFQTIEMIRQLNLDDIVYHQSGWRVHDIVTHLTWFDEQAVAIIQAFLDDRIYQPPIHLSVESRKDVHRRNAWIRRQRYAKEPEDVIAEFIQAHEDLKSVILKVGTTRMHEIFTAFWGDRITVHTLAVWQIQHDQYHRRDLAKILGCPDGLDNRVYRLIYSEI